MLELLQQHPDVFEIPGEPAEMEAVEIGPAQGYKFKTSKNEPRNFSVELLAEQWIVRSIDDPSACIVITESTACLEAEALNRRGVPYNRIVAFNNDPAVAAIIRDNPSTPGLNVICANISEAAKTCALLGLKPVAISIDPTHNASMPMFRIMNDNWSDLKDKHDVLWSINVYNGHSKAMRMWDKRFRIGHRDCHAIAVVVNTWEPSYSPTHKVLVEGLARYTDEVNGCNTTFEMGIIRTVRKDSGKAQSRTIPQLDGDTIIDAKIKLAKPKQAKSKPKMTKGRRAHLEKAAIEREQSLLDALVEDRLPPTVESAIKGMSDEETLDWISHIALHWSLKQEADFTHKPGKWMAEQFIKRGHFEGLSETKIAGQLASATRRINALTSGKVPFWPPFSMTETEASSNMA